MSDLEPDLTQFQALFAQYDNGRFELIRIVGSGGMGTVFQAQDKKFDLSCAIKILNIDLIEDEQTVARFTREAIVMRRIHHDTIVQVYDYGKVDDLSFIAMEWVEGGSLEDHLTLHGALDLQTAVALIVRVCDGLERVHEAGIIHRDIKPANILVSKNGDPKLTDFGIAFTQKVGPRLTATGMTAGTKGYMAPEQGAGERDLDGRTDEHALAVTLWALLRGEDPPRELFFTPTLSKHPEDTNWMPPALVPIFLKAVSIHREDRYPTVGVFREALEQMMGFARGVQTPIRLTPVVVPVGGAGNSPVSDTDAASQVLTALAPVVTSIHSATGAIVSATEFKRASDRTSRRHAVRYGAIAAVVIGLGVSLPLVFNRDDVQISTTTTHDDQPTPPITTTTRRDIESERCRARPLELTPPPIEWESAEAETRLTERPLAPDTPIRIASVKAVRPWKGQPTESPPGGKSVPTEVKPPEVVHESAVETVLVRVSTVNDPAKTWIVNASGRHQLPAQVPPGTYRVVAKFGDDHEFVAIRAIVVTIGSTPHIECDGESLHCHVIH